VLVEHIFVTTMEMEEALDLAAGFLKALGFRLDSVEANCIHAVRGKGHTNTRKVSQLPQEVSVEYDRGRVTAVASIMQRGKDLPVYSRLVTALVRGLEDLLVNGAEISAAGRQWRLVDSGAGTVWTGGEKLIWGCLWLFVAIAVIIAIVVAVTV